MYHLVFKQYTEVQLLFRNVNTDKIKIIHTFVFHCEVKGLELNLKTLIDFDLNYYTGLGSSKAEGPNRGMKLFFHNLGWFTLSLPLLL